MSAKNQQLSTSFSYFSTTILVPKLAKSSAILSLAHVNKRMTSTRLFSLGKQKKNKSSFFGKIFNVADKVSSKKFLQYFLSHFCSKLLQRMRHNFWLIMSASIKALGCEHQSVRLRASKRSVASKLERP